MIVMSCTRGLVLSPAAPEDLHGPAVDLSRWAGTQLGHCGHPDVPHWPSVTRPGWSTTRKPTSPPDHPIARLDFPEWEVSGKSMACACHPCAFHARASGRPLWGPNHIQQPTIKLHPHLHTHSSYTQPYR